MPVAAGIGAWFTFLNYRRGVRAKDPTADFTWNWGARDGTVINAKATIHNRGDSIIHIKSVYLRSPWPRFGYRREFSLSSTALLDSRPLVPVHRRVPVNIEVSSGKSQPFDFFIFWHSQDKKERRLRLDIEVALTSSNIKNRRITIKRMIPIPPDMAESQTQR